jgi:hypothetical protein
MRIIGNIEHPILKITVFKMDNKFSVKFESGLYEQTYKFRSSDAISGLESIQKVVDATFCEEVLQELNRMHQRKNQAMARTLPQEVDTEFEEII